MIPNTRPVSSRFLVSPVYRLQTPGEWIDHQEADRRVKLSLKRLVAVQGAPKVSKEIAGYPCLNDEELTTRTVLLLKVPTR